MNADPKSAAIHRLKSHCGIATFMSHTLQELSTRPEIEVREWSREIVENLGDLLTAKEHEELHRRYRVMGKVRFEENIPLHEAVLRFHLLKDKIVEFVHEQGWDGSSTAVFTR